MITAMFVLAFVFVFCLVGLCFALVNVKVYETTVWDIIGSVSFVGTWASGTALGVLASILFGVS